MLRPRVRNEFLLLQPERGALSGEELRDLRWNVWLWRHLIPFSSRIGVVYASGVLFFPFPLEGVGELDFLL